MKRYAYIMILALIGSPHLTNAFVLADSSLETHALSVDPLFQTKVKKLQDSVKVSWNPITTIRNKSYRLPTLKQYRERLQIAIHVFNTTGKTRLLTQTCVIGYQNSWIRKHTSLNAAVEMVKFSPHFACIAAVFLARPRLLRGFSPSRLLERFHID